MTDRVFVDTNVLVYAYDRSEPDKQQMALQVLNQLHATHSGVISTQVLSEFFVTVTRKLKPQLSPEDAYERIKNYVQAWETVDMTAAIILEAARGVRDHQFSFWDAQIWAAARLNQITVIFSEDFNVGSTIDGIEFVNPFANDFRLEEWQ
jgi:predicted nucleic acid-binding protein